jgi:aldose 1-epimerase
MKSRFAPIIPLILLAAFIIYHKSCDKQQFSKNKKEKIMKEDLKVFTLENSHGNMVKITNYGAKVISIIVPDKYGIKGNVVLGYDSVHQYLEGNPYFGAVIGRYANRIDNGKITLDGETYELPQNDGENHLHGGPGGFHNVLWETREFKDQQSEALELTYLSPDDEQGYPGNLSVKVIYTWTDQNELKINYTAITDKKTVINLTHHSFFNLKDGGKSKITDHELMINAKYFTPVNKELIPTGKIKKVEGTPLDFSTMHPIKTNITADYEQLKYGKGYDHNYVLNKSDNDFALAAKVLEPETGRGMKVFTDKPGLQFYSGNSLKAPDRDRGGIAYKQRSGFCLEAQHYPDSPNHPDFPSTVLRPGETYKQTTIYQFYVKENKSN